MTTADGSALETRMRPAGPLDLRRTLGPLRRGVDDPTMRLEATRAWRATRTPLGAASESLELTRDGLLVRAWGPGAPWLIEHASRLVGLDDAPGDVSLDHPVLRRLAASLPGLRIGRTDAVLEALVPAVLEQKVTGTQARRGFRGLVGAFGERAPGPLGLRLPPAPEVLARTPYYAFHPFEIEQHRADIVRRVARQAERLEAIVGLPLPDAYARLRAVPGVGAWTAAEVGARALGDPDAVSVGDFHLPHQVCWVLAGEPRGTDERMLELLEPYRGQRGRVIRLIEASGMRPPARGPRLAARSIARD
jgi:3-methyladenine DNA glycosylase/8-oxoguanine DNA glycosylase